MKSMIMALRNQHLILILLIFQDSKLNSIMQDWRACLKEYNFRYWEYIHCNSQYRLHLYHLFDKVSYLKRKFRCINCILYSMMCKPLYYYMYCNYHLQVNIIHHRSNNTFLSIKGKLNYSNPKLRIQHQ